MAVQLHGAPMETITRLPQRFERKHYLAPREVGLAYGLLRQICLPDSAYYSEQINSLYFDTRDLDQHKRSFDGDYQKDKVRIRWYGEGKNPHGMQTVFLELKSRRGFASAKQRLALQVPADSLALENLKKGIVSRNLLMGTLVRFGFFPTRMLQPVIQISYWRYRFSEIMTEQRISLDHHIRSTMIMPGSGNGERELALPGGVIEIKGQDMELPTTLRQVRVLDTDWTRFSKYSACIDSHIEQPGSIGRTSPSGRIIRP